MSSLTQDAKYGLGVKFTSVGPWTDALMDDELGTHLALANGPVSTLSISFEAAKLVERFTVSQKVHGSKGQTIGFYRIDGGGWQSLVVGNNGQGTFDVLLEQTLVSTISFAGSADFIGGYWLRSIDMADVATDVTEPTSMILFGAALLVGAGRLRSRT
jgi:hypothetical protein